MHEGLLVAEQIAHVNLQDIVFEACTRVALTIKDGEVRHLEGRKHLPIFRLREAA